MIYIVLSFYTVEYCEQRGAIETNTTLCVNVPWIISTFKYVTINVQDGNILQSD